MTPSERIAELEEENAYLRGELGMLTDNDAVARIRAALGIRTGAARLLFSLYRSNRTLPTWQLVALLPPGRRGDETHLIKVYVSFVRKALGRDAVETTWGIGYRLTQVGRGKLSIILGDKGKKQHEMPETLESSSCVLPKLQTQSLAV